MQSIYEWISDRTGLSVGFQEQMVVTLVVLILLWGARRLVMNLVRRQTDSAKARYQWKKISLYVVVIIAVLFIGRTWFAGFGSILTYLGLVSAGLAVALQDPITNIAAWVFILWRRPLEVGDRVAIGDFTGDVIDIRLFQFTILEVGNWVDADQSTGRVVHVPNGKIFTESQANYSQGFRYIWNEIPLQVTFESNWRKAKDILQEVIDSHSSHLSTSAEDELRAAARKYMIFYSKLSPTVYVDVRDSGVLLTARYLCEPRNRRGSAHEILQEVLDRFNAENDVNFAYPTTRVYSRAFEGRAEGEGRRAEGKDEG